MRFADSHPTTQGRHPLRLSVSRDFGETWQTARDLETENGEFSYPAIVIGSNNKLHITYTWNRTHIKYVMIEI